MMMSSSMARTASVSISSNGKKRLLSLFSLVRNTLRGTATLGQSDSVTERRRKRKQSANNNTLSVSEKMKNYERWQQLWKRERGWIHLNTSLSKSTYESDHTYILLRAEETTLFIFSCVRSWEEFRARRRQMAHRVSPHKTDERKSTGTQTQRP